MNPGVALIALPVMGLVGGEPPPAGDDPKPGTLAQPATPARGVQPEPNSASPATRDAMLLDIARRYGDFHLASPWPAWTIPMCRAVMPSEVTGVPSRSDDQRTHGDKIYKLWVSDDDAYMHVCGFARKPHLSSELTATKSPLTTSPIGQTLVKETFAAVAVTPKEEPKPNPYRPGLIVDGDKTFRQGAPAELFIMTKVDPRTSDTDNGWIYAVVSADRKSVLRSGRLESCMKCHDQTTRDRLYGPEETWPKDKDGKAMLPIVAANAAEPKASAPEHPAENKKP